MTLAMGSIQSFYCVITYLLIHNSQKTPVQQAPLKKRRFGKKAPSLLLISSDFSPTFLLLILEIRPNFVAWIIFAWSHSPKLLQ